MERWWRSLKIVIMEPQDNEEDQIIFKCRSMTPELLRIIARLKAQNSLVAYKENQIYRIKPSDIYYIEAVDNKVFI
jgi:DNA-binding LytR/AlgR family response regulator